MWGSSGYWLFVAEASGGYWGWRVGGFLLLVVCDPRVGRVGGLENFVVCLTRELTWSCGVCYPEFWLIHVYPRGTATATFGANLLGFVQCNLFW